MVKLMIYHIINTKYYDSGSQTFPVRGPQKNILELCEVRPCVPLTRYLRVALVTRLDKALPKQKLFCWGLL
jgi:hypothetical protein